MSRSEDAALEVDEDDMILFGQGSAESAPAAPGRQARKTLLLGAGMHAYDPLFRGGGAGGAQPRGRTRAEGGKGNGECDGAGGP